MLEGATQRGFSYIRFEDEYGHTCSLQKSSRATEDCIWLGREDAKDAIGASARMHLTQEQVAMLLPYLTRFVETGELFAPRTSA